MCIADIMKIMITQKYPMPRTKVASACIRPFLPLDFSVCNIAEGWPLAAFWYNKMSSISGSKYSSGEPKFEIALIRRISSLAILSEF